tara:strand:- start:1731 stop:1916 length:186 start_codon:yes stop_codon:yes gene_type:complete
MEFKIVRDTMSDYGKHQTQRIMDSAAKVAINKFMQQDDAEKISALREALGETGAIDAADKH